MITLENSIELQQVILKKLPAMPATLTPGSVFTYILLDQAEPETLHITSYGADAIWSKWKISSKCSKQGVKFLLPLQEFKEALQNLNSSYALQINQTATGIVLETFTSQVDNIVQTLDKISIRSFSGSIDEFIIPEFTSTLEDVNSTVIFKHSDLQALIWQLSNFADFTTSTSNSAIRINADILAQTVCGYCKQNNDPTFFLRSSLTTAVTEDVCWVFLGTHINKLSVLEGADILFINLDKHVEVISPEANLILPKQDLDYFGYLKPIPTYFENGEEDMQEVDYIVPSNRFAEALAAQQPSKSTTSRHITLKDTADGHLLLGKQADFLAREFSKVDLYGRDYIANPPSVTDLIVLISATGLLKSLKVIKYCLNHYKINKDEINFRVYYRDTGNGKRWVVQLALIQTSNIKVVPIIAGGVRVEET